MASEKEVREQLEVVLEKKAGTVGEQIGRIALMSRVTGEYVTYRDGKFMDCHGRNVAMNPSDVVDDVSWLQDGEDLLDFYTRIGRDVPPGEKVDVGVLTKLQQENAALVEENAALKLVVAEFNQKKAESKD